MFKEFLNILIYVPWSQSVFSEASCDVVIMRLRTCPQVKAWFTSSRGEDGGAELEAERSLQVRVLVPAGEQVHQGGSAVSETD